MPGGGHHHRAGAMRQANKKNKRSKASKRSLSRAAGGKVMGGGGGKGAGGGGKNNTMISQSKANRRNRQQQIRDTKRQAIMRKRRGLTDSTPGAGVTAASLPPRVVGIISLGPTTTRTNMEEKVRDFILSGADRVVVRQRPSQTDNHNNNNSIEDTTTATAATASPVTCKFDVHKKDGQLTLLTSSSVSASSLSTDTDNGSSDDHAVFAALDLARVCDALLLVIDGNAGLLEPGRDIITEIHLGGDDDHHHDTRSTATGKSNTTTSSSTGGVFDHLICGDRILAALKAQGLPTPLTVLAKTEKDPFEQQQEDDDHMTIQSTKSLRRSSFKRRHELKKYVNRFATTEFGTGNDRVVEVDLTCMNNNNANDHDGDNNNNMMDDGATSGDNREVQGMAVAAAVNTRKNASAALVRTLCTMSCCAPKWVSISPRSYLISEDSVVDYDEAKEELSLTGYVRGMAPFDCNSLVHVPHLGTFATKSVRRVVQPLQLLRHNNRRKVEKDTTAMHTDGTTTTTAGDAALNADPELQESLNMFATPDNLEGEQNLIGFDDDEFDTGDNNQDSGFSRPAGWSDYQSAWLDAVDDDDIPDDAVDRGELAEELNKKPTTTFVGGGDVAMDLDDANDVAAEDKRVLSEQRRKEQKEHQEFPDEVEVDEDAKASDRFARFRSLKSFRKSYWDPKENLPETYASVYHFQSFKATQRSVMNEKEDTAKAAEHVQGQFWGSTPETEDEGDAPMDDSSDEDEDLLAGCVPSGSYIKLTLRDVSPDRMKSLSTNSILTSVSLLPHENKVSVLHMGLCQSPSCEGTDEVPVKSKDVLTFRCGWRTWKSRPVFSQHNLNCDKHKFERYMPVGGAFFAASVFGPVTYTPCPVLVFRDSGSETSNNNGQQQLVATGSMIGADADRVVVKRIVLTGYPVRVHKRHATVKYMFYNPDDVKWFKPAGLYTKHGLQGNIVESIGEHGTMKCLFNAPIKQHDTVCLPLYKRIFPKYFSDNDNKEHLVVR